MFDHVPFPNKPPLNPVLSRWRHVDPLVLGAHLVLLSHHDGGLVLQTQRRAEGATPDRLDPGQPVAGKWESIRRLVPPSDTWTAVAARAMLSVAYASFKAVTCADVCRQQTVSDGRDDPPIL
jgi:hypothetical protein